MKTYKIGEAAVLLELKTYVLRFWETEFPQLVPLRTDKGQRLYTEDSLALLRRIKSLLHEQGMTIEGARRVLDAPEVPVNMAAPKASPHKTVPLQGSLLGNETTPKPASLNVAHDKTNALLASIALELREIRTLLASPLL